ncbi:MAG: transglutaminase domain-containing protein [Planctomycetota bacterium]|jgi:hypothetical protein
MTRHHATTALGGTACMGLLLCGATNPLIPLVCMAGIFFQALVLVPGGRRVPAAVVATAHTALILPFFYLALLRDPPLEFLTLLLTFAAPLLLLRSYMPQSDFNDFLIFLVSLLLVVGSAAVAPVWIPLLITGLYVLVVCQALPVLTRRPADLESGVRFRRIGWRAGGWIYVSALATHHLGMAGLILGGVLYLVVPRPNTDLAPASSDRHLADGRSGGSGRTGSTAARTGFPRDVRIGDIGRIKRKPFLALRLELRARGRLYDPTADEGTMLLLRARAWQTYSPRSRGWRRLRSAKRPLGPSGLLQRGPALLDWRFEVLGYDGLTLFLPQRARKVLSPVPLFVDGAGVVTAAKGASHYGVEGAWPLRPSELARLVPDRHDRRLLAVPRALLTDLRRHVPPRQGRGLAAAVAAIRGLFAEGFRYTLDLPAGLPRDRDPLIAFLERKEGHCELYASTACLFLRYMGIPARLAGGLRCSEWLAPGRYQARFSNAHAWVEVPCVDVGFVAIDFTPPDSRAVGGSAEAGGAVGDPSPAGVEGETEAPSFDWRDPFRYGPEDQERVLAWMGKAVGSLYFLGTVGLALLTLFLWTAVAMLRRGEPDPLRVSAPPGVARQTLAFYARWLRACAAKGHVRRHCQTPREFLASLPAGLRATGGPITADFEVRRYGAGG